MSDEEKSSTATLWKPSGDRNSDKALMNLSMAQIKSRMSDDEQRAVVRSVMRPMLDALEQTDSLTIEGEYARRLVNGALGGAGAVDLDRVD